VPKYRFLESDSQEFIRLINAEASSEKEFTEASLDDPELDCIKLPGIKLDQFRPFLKVLYPRYAF